MTNNFRALCAELADAYLRTLEHINNSTWLGYEPSDDPLLQRARAALAEANGPAVPESREPASVTAKPSDEDSTVMEIIELSSEIEAAGLGQVDFARAVLARWGRPAPAPPADGEVAELVAWLRSNALTVKKASGNPANGARQRMNRAAELLQRQVPVPPAGGEVMEVVEWLHTVVAAYKSCHNTDHIWSLSGNGVNARLTVTLLTRAAELLQRQVLVPVPVSERLPGDQLCWWLEPDEEDDEAYGSSWTLLRICGGTSSYTHWLPAQALPIPHQQENAND